jgi:hypothetical protein
MTCCTILLLNVCLAAGAPADDWWALQPLARRDPPKQLSSWVRTPIDAFILKRLTENGLSPSPEADRRTLIRRLTYNLHGLPPTPEEIDAFVNDKSIDAYDKLIDRLLGSPRYGERWGRHWLDVVHFGETHGYDKDKRRPNAWPYRDYVIRSLNGDKPYSRFVTEQIAGDVLFPDDPDATVATGFIAAGPWDFVGHVELPETKTDGLIARYNDRDDMVSTVMSTFQSLTVHCARCHDHKFDPITQEDYYRLQAVFAGTDRADRPYDRDPDVHRTRRSLLAEQKSLGLRERVVAEKSRMISSLELKQFDERLTELSRQLASIAKTGASPSNGYHSAIVPTADVTKWVQVDLGKSTPIDAIRLVPARPTDFPDTPGFGFPLRYRVEVSDDEQFASSRTLVDRSAADEPSPGDQPVVISARGQAGRFVRVTATRLWKRTDDFVFALAEMQVVRDGKHVASGARVTALDSIEAGRWSTKFLTDGYSSRQPLDPTAGDSDGQKRKTIEAEIALATKARDECIDRLLDDATRRERADVAQKLVEVNERLGGLPAPSMVYAAASGFKPQGGFVSPERPRPIHLLNRGDVKQPGKLMAPGALACITELAFRFEISDLRSQISEANDEGLRRAALARWITDPKNPLTHRSIVNRVWQYHFGRGIVDTPNDFGRMGGKPTHPELLDWLATWFWENGESLKKLHKLILTSSVYRQRSQGNAEYAQIDADNRYLWHMNRTRLDAESIRDAALHVAGKLDLTMGGPSVDHFFFKDDHSPVYDYTQFDVDSAASYRRSVYRFIVRSVPDPFMDCLDCADPSLLVPKRNTTLTALQALSMMNNRLMVKGAEHFSERIIRAGGNLDQQIGLSYQLAFGRSPRPEEVRLLADFVAEYGLANGCRLILNSNEFIFVD